VILSESRQVALRDLPAEFHQMIPAEEESEQVSLEAFTNRARKRYIGKVLRDCGGKKVEAAGLLQVNRSYLFQLIKQLGIEEEPQEEG